MSAVIPKADIDWLLSHLRFMPIADIDRGSRKVRFVLCFKSKSSLSPSGAVCRMPSFAQDHERALG